MLPLTTSTEATQFSSAVAGRVLFDIVCLGVLTLILLNVLIAILVNSFSELRERRVRSVLLIPVCVLLIHSIFDFSTRLDGKGSSEQYASYVAWQRKTLKPITG